MEGNNQAEKDLSVNPDHEEVKGDIVAASDESIRAQSMREHLENLIG